MAGSIEVIFVMFSVVIAQLFPLDDCVAKRQSFIRNLPRPSTHTREFAEGNQLAGAAANETLLSAEVGVSTEPNQDKDSSGEERSKSRQQVEAENDPTVGEDIKDDKQGTTSPDGIADPSANETSGKQDLSDDQESELSEARALVRLGKQSDVVDLTSRILKKWPDCVEAQVMRGIAFLGLEKISESILDLTAAIDSQKMRSRQSLMYLSRGIAYSHQEKWSEALSDMDKAILVDPKNMQLWLTRGNLFQRCKDYKRAVEDYSKALLLEPNVPNQAILLSARSDAYSLEGKADLALKDMNRVLKLKPKDPAAWMNRAAIYIHEKKWEQSIADLNQCIDYAPMGKLSNSALSLRADCLKNAGKYEESLKDYSNLVLAYRSDPRIVSKRAEVYMLMGQNEKALDDANTCLKKSASDPQLYELRAKIYKALGKDAEAQQDLASAKSFQK